MCLFSLVQIHVLQEALQDDTVKLYFEVHFCIFYLYVYICTVSDFTGHK